MSMLDRDRIFRVAEQAQGIHDPAIAKHKDELFGTPSNPDFTPADQRNPGPGRVLVEWVGEDGPMADRKLAAAVELGLIPKAIVDAWKTLHTRITTRIPGMCHHTMTRERDGMSETYTWGPHAGTYVQAVRHEDADKLLAGTFGRQFRVLNYVGHQPADDTPIDRFLSPYVDADTVDQVRHIVIEEGAPERLVGVASTGGKRLGAWT
jgi:hypothetical protein